MQADVIKDNIAKQDIANMIEEITNLESPFGGYGEWYDGKDDALKIVCKYCMKYCDSNSVT